MKDSTSEGGAGAIGPGIGELNGGHRRTLDALFRHPTAQNLEWMDVISLFENIGAVREKPNDKVSFEFGGQHLVLPRGHGKDVNASEVASLRDLIRRGQGSGTVTPQDVIVVEIDHHAAKLFSLGTPAANSQVRDIKPYDPHHFLHHLTHKGQSREEGQRSAEDPSFYARISEALAAATRIVVVGHGRGKSDSALHLMDYLKRHHPETHRNVVRVIDVDLSALTLPQISALVHQALEGGHG
ncbi:MAG: hypothetical protein JSS29_03315 [Proteobacteria bacterium]|nr:hypothetical protein [Pseudomonadota bacterium]